MGGFSTCAADWVDSFASRRSLGVVLSVGGLVLVVESSLVKQPCSKWVWHCVLLPNNHVCGGERGLGLHGSLFWTLFTHHGVVGGVSSCVGLDCDGRFNCEEELVLQGWPSYGWVANTWLGMVKEGVFWMCTLPC